MLMILRIWTSRSRFKIAIPGIKITASFKRLESGAFFVKKSTIIKMNVCFITIE